MKKNNFGRPAGWSVLRPNLPGGSLWKDSPASAGGRYFSAGQIALVNSLSAQSWTLTSAPTQSWTGVASSADGTQLVAVADDFPIGTIYISKIDSGSTWNQTTA